MIKIKNLVKQYGDKYAVNDISFSVGDGEIVGFLGPNGAGKSTTMNMLTGYLSSTSGTISIDGFDILENTMEAKKLIGYLPEQPPLYMDMTVIEYLNFVYELKKCTFNREKHLEEICEVVKLSDVKNRIIGHLSKGYRQRVGIAQAIVGNPKVTLFFIFYYPIFLKYLMMNLLCFLLRLQMPIPHQVLYIRHLHGYYRHLCPPR